MGTNWNELEFNWSKNCFTFLIKIELQNKVKINFRENKKVLFGTFESLCVSLAYTSIVDAKNERFENALKYSANSQN